MNNKKAFTLTELIIALGIIGAIAALTVPSIMKNINRKILSSQVKNTVASVQQLVTDQMVVHHTKILEDTDFGTPATLLGSDFEINGACTDGNTDNPNPCWASAYKVIKTSGNKIYTTTLSGNGSTVASTLTAQKLKNGVAIAYQLDSTTVGSETALGKFYIDVNSADEPNVIGRDFFAFYVTKKGKLVGAETAGCSNLTDPSIDSGLNCFTSLVNNNWKMPDNDSDY